ncbi:unnamed protein product [Brachionus calyciflorus]|uniref:Signal peptidase complex subunit 2 n=1 Tax=Brachionus calyciflorus TaxID=104777 RepID=A0A814NR88_9BILA|nr:unnamed protein product [Brachionus calyciflorus]
MSKISFKTELPEDSNETVVEKWDWNAVKNALDDSARKFLNNQNGFQEDHSLMNGRLIVSTVAVLFSLYAIGYDYLHPFPESRLVLIVCVVFYFIFIGILTLYTSFVEKGTFAEANYKSDNKVQHWKFASKQKPKEENIYVLDIELTDGKKVIKKTFEQSIARYFDEKGALVTKNLYQDLSKYCTNVLNEEQKKGN